MQHVEAVAVDLVFRPKITESDVQANSLRTLGKQVTVAKNDRLRRPVVIRPAASKVPGRYRPVRRW